MTAPSEIRERSGHKCAPPTGADLPTVGQWVCPSATCRAGWRVVRLGPALVWRMTGATEPEAPIPAPEVLTRLAKPDEICKGARSILALAERHGWTVQATYARGTYETKTTRRVVDSLALRMRRPPARRAVAIWHDGAFATAITYEIGEELRSRNATQLRAWLTDGGTS